MKKPTAKTSRIFKQNSELSGERERRSSESCRNLVKKINVCLREKMVCTWYINIIISNIKQVLKLLTIKTNHIKYCMKGLKEKKNQIQKA